MMYVQINMRESHYLRFEKCLKCAHTAASASPHPIELLSICVFFSGERSASRCNKRLLPYLARRAGVVENCCS